MATAATVRIPKPALFASPGRRNLVLSLLLAVAVLALYNPIARDPFVNYDDDRYVTDNALVRAGLHWETVKWAFTSYEEANWHPLTWLSHALDCQLFGLNPAGHHYVNVLLHALNAVLLFWVLVWATGAAGRSYMVAALFALHPINVESVAWVAERKNILSLLFSLLALAAYGYYAKKPSIGRYCGVMVLFACGLMAKPMVITFPFVLLLWDYWPLKRMDSKTGEPQNFLWLAIEKLPLMALSAASAMVTLEAQRTGEAIRSTVQYPVGVRIENSLVSYVRYAGKLFWPSHLSPIYPHPGHSLSLWQAVAAGAVIFLLTGLVLAGRKHRYLLVGWFWFLGTLVPMIGLVQVGNQAMADRYAYLPFIGLFVLVAWGVGDWAAVRRISMPQLAAAGAVCGLGLVIVTYRQIGFWKDNVSLWSHAIEVTVPNFVAEDNLGGALIEAGRTDEAMAHFRRAVAIEPSDAMSRLNLAADEQRHGNFLQAIAQFGQVIDATDDVRLRARAFTDLGFCYRETGNRVRAKESFQLATRLRPESTFRAWVGLGLIAHDSGDETEAIRDYSRSLSIQPWDLSYFLLARALEKSGRREESQAAVQEAMRLSPDFNQLQQVGDDLLAK